MVLQGANFNAVVVVGELAWFPYFYSDCPWPYCGPYAKYQCSSGKKSWLFECIGWCSIAAKKVKEKSLLKLVFPFLHPTFCNRICRKIVVVVGSVSVMKDQRHTRYTHIPCRKNISWLAHMQPNLLTIAFQSVMNQYKI